MVEIIIRDEEDILEEIWYEENVLVVLVNMQSSYWRVSRQGRGIRKVY